MKKTFSSYFTPQTEFFAALWGKAFFALDTNVLLDLYRYSDKTRGELLTILSSIKDRIWIPHQVGLEFARTRPEVISTQVQMYQKAQDFVGSLRTAVRKEIDSAFNFRIHPVLNPDEFRKSLEAVLGDLSAKIDKYQRAHPDFFAKDPVLSAVCDLLDGRVGSPYAATRMEEIFKTGKERYEKFIPPGYADSTGPGKKDGDAVYSDLVLWFQLIDRAKTQKQPLILVSNDLKEDWWWQSKGRTLGCRPELRDEFLRESGQHFYMYTSDRFLEYAPQYLKVKVSGDSIREVKTVQEDEQQRRAESERNYMGSLLEMMKNADAKYKSSLAQLYNQKVQQIMEQQWHQETGLRHMMESPLSQTSHLHKVLEDAIKHEVERHQMLETLVDSASQVRQPPDAPASDEVTDGTPKTTTSKVITPTKKNE